MGQIWTVGRSVPKSFFFFRFPGFFSSADVFYGPESAIYGTGKTRKSVGKEGETFARLK